MLSCTICVTIIRRLIAIVLCLLTADVWHENCHVMIPVFCILVTKMLHSCPMFGLAYGLFSFEHD